MATWYLQGEDWAVINNWSSNFDGTGSNPAEVPWSGELTKNDDLAPGALYSGSCQFADSMDILEIDGGTGVCSIPNITTHNWIHILYGIFTGDGFSNDGKIYDGIFTGTNFTNGVDLGYWYNGTIYGGNFTCSNFTNRYHMFGGVVVFDTFVNAWSIYAGTFNGTTFTNGAESQYSGYDGFIYGGNYTCSTFNNVNLMYGGVVVFDSCTNSGWIKSGYFIGGALINGATGEWDWVGEIEGGIFLLESCLVNFHIYGGIFTGSGYVLRDPDQWGSLPSVIGTWWNKGSVKVGDMLLKASGDPNPFPLSPDTYSDPSIGVQVFDTTFETSDILGAGLL
jgi:hypothetical protein